MLREWCGAVGVLVWLLPRLVLAEPTEAAVAAAQVPDPEGTQSLITDVRLVVAAHEVDDWFADREAMRSIETHLLPSLCRATPAARAAALSALQAQQAALGDAKQLYAQAGELSEPVERALTAQHELDALSAVLVRQNECPFWVRPERGFHGLQTDRKRVTLNVESGGVVQFRLARQHVTFGGGGAGRLLVGYGVDGRYTLLLGPEFGGSALLRPNSNASEVVVNYFPALPLVFRSRQPTWHYDIEVAPVALFEADNTARSYGARLGAAFAFTALRRRNVLAWAGLAVAYEHYFDGGGRGPIDFFRGGLRIGLPWDP